MCGIAGILSPDYHPLDAVFRMTEAQSHRGPDGEGYVFFAGSKPLVLRAPVTAADLPAARLGLGHRRLAILDRSEFGLQPMSADSGRYWICHNGEVYNYIELREELESLDFRFGTGTDTEVILAAYRAWGVECFRRFNGMWGMAIWDGRKNCLVLSRDRFGIKPLHYARSNDALLFASEIKGILAAHIVPADLNLTRAAQYLRMGLVNHDGLTFFDGIHAFPPGCYAVVDPSRPLEWQPKSFWSLKATSEDLRVPIEQAQADFRELFSSAVRMRMRSDVPVGSCLSGGLDSSAIVCTAASMRESDAEPFHTFTSGSSDPRFDESAWADLVNERVCAAAHRVFPTQEGFERDLLMLIWHQEEPFTTASIYAQWCVMRAARETGVPVLLDGQGGDEIFCGYRKFYILRLRELLEQRRWLSLIAEGAGLLLRGDRSLWRWREGVRYLPGFIRSRMEGLGDLITDSFRQAWQDSELELTSAPGLRERQVEDLFRYSLPSLLRYEDRNSMAWAVESRVPFLDYRLVEYIVALPTRYKLSGGRAKVLIRDGLRGIVPDQILDRRDKMGFVTPQEKWMRSDLGRRIESAFRSSGFRLHSLINRDRLMQAYSLFASGKGSSAASSEFFRVFLLNAWAERFDVRI